MPDTFLHGVQIVEISDGKRQIKTTKSSVIGIIGTAPSCDALKYPINVPVLLSGVSPSSAGIGTTGSLPNAIDGLMDQAGCLVVVIRIADSNVDATQVANLVGSAGDLTGVHAFKKAQSTIGVTPRILIAPEFTHRASVLSELLVVAGKLRAVVIADAGDSDATPSEAQQYAEDFSSDRLYLIYPYVKVSRNGIDVAEPASARVAGIIAKTDNEKGFWWSPSNQTIQGIVGVNYPVDFILGESTSLANVLNENKVATIINIDGYRLWGNRTTSSDSKWAFLQTRRTADIINDSLLTNSLWCVDRNITKTFVSDVIGGVNSYLNVLQAQGAILGGRCWADPELNTSASLAQGKIYFSFDFCPPTPAESVTFRSLLNQDYLEDVV